MPGFTNGLACEHHLSFYVHYVLGFGPQLLRNQGSAPQKEAKQQELPTKQATEVG